MNLHQSEEKKRSIITLYIVRSVKKRRADRLRAIKVKRNTNGVLRIPDQSERGQEKEVNLLPSIIEVVKAYAFLQEVCHLLRRVNGKYRE